MLIMLDGIDGSGKSTVIQAWKEYLSNQGNAIFDLKNYWMEKNKYPSLEEIKSYDIIFSCEPTRTGIGQVIREELIHRGNDYPPRAIAEAYSLDRLILYKKIIIPLLEDEKIVIQDRGVSTSLSYQTMQSPDLNLTVVAELTGNKLALEHRPDHLVLMDISPEEALKRLADRAGKVDNAIFEKLEYLQKFSAQFKNEEYQKIFTSRGTQIHYLSANDKIDIMKDRAVLLLKNILTI